MTYGSLWYYCLNNSFQYLNNIIRIFIYFFTYTYFHKTTITLLEISYQIDVKLVVVLNFFFFCAQFFKDKNFCHKFFYNLEFVKVIDNKGLSLSVGFNSFFFFFHNKINCNKNCIPTFCHPMIETGNASPI